MGLLDVCVGCCFFDESIFCVAKFCSWIFNIFYLFFICTFVFWINKLLQTIFGNQKKVYFKCCFDCSHIWFDVFSQCRFCGHKNNLGSNLVIFIYDKIAPKIVFMILLFTREYEELANIFECYVSLFIVSMIPGMLYYVLEIFGISLSIGRIQSQNQLLYADSAEYSGAAIGYYKLYLGAVMRLDSNTRMSGIYDEPGLVGTVAALLLCGKKFAIKNDWKAKLLLLITIMSFSFAGYILVFAYILLKLFKEGKWKLVVVLLLAAFSLLILVNVDLSNTPMAGIQRRIQITDAGISFVNNRQTSTFEKGYLQFRRAGLLTKLFGFGYGASSRNSYLLGSSTYKLTIYDGGYVGFAIKMLFFILYFAKWIKLQNIKKYWNAICLLVIFLVSIYQRPSVFYAYYFIALFGGASRLVIDVDSKIKEGAIQCK